MRYADSVLPGKPGQLFMWPSFKHSVINTVFWVNCLLVLTLLKRECKNTHSFKVACREKVSSDFVYFADYVQGVLMTSICHEGACFFFPISAWLCQWMKVSIIVILFPGLLSHNLCHLVSEDGDQQSPTFIRTALFMSTLVLWTLRSDLHNIWHF